MGCILPFRSFLAQESKLQGPVRITLLTKQSFSSQKDYKTLHEVTVCFTPASNGTYSLQPSVPGLISVPLTEGKRICYAVHSRRMPLGK